MFSSKFCNGKGACPCFDTRNNGPGSSRHVILPVSKLVAISLTVLILSGVSRTERSEFRLFWGAGTRVARSGLRSVLTIRASRHGVTPVTIALAQGYRSIAFFLRRSPAGMPKVNYV